MNPRLRPLVAALCLQAACCADAQQASPANLERVEVAGKKAEVSPWFRAESPHFIVYSDTREEDVAPLLDNLERLDQLLRVYTLSTRGDEENEPKLTLYFHSRLSVLRDIDAAMPADAVGLYSSCGAGVQGFAVHLGRLSPLSDEQLEKAALNDTLSYAFEAYARHFLLRHTDIRVPTSFIDGFAQYFSSVRFSPRQMVVGRPPQAIAGYLRFLGAGRRYGLDWDDVLEGRLANAHSLGGQAGARLEFEAKSWLLTHYMLSSDDKRRRLSRYLALIGDGMAPTAAFERAFAMKVDELGRVMWRYGLQGTQVLRVEQPDAAAARVSFRSLPRAAGEVLLADAALRACPGRAAGEALLKQVAGVAARFPDAEAVRLTLSRAQIDWGDPQQALTRLDALLQDDEANFEAEVLAGMAHLRLAERREDEGRSVHLQSAQRHLRRAQTLNPRSGEAALALFRAEVAAAQEPDAAALQGVIAAWQAARDVDALGRSAALAYAYAGQADEAYRTLGALVQDPRDPALAPWARQWRGRLETGVSRADILAEMRRSGVPEHPLKEWTLDKQSVLQKVELADGLEAADSFIKEQLKQQNPAAQPPAGAAGNGGKR